MDLGAFTIGQSITVTGQSNFGATGDSLEAPSCIIYSSLGGVWYKLSVTVPARIEASTCNQADFDTQIAIYSGTCGSLVCQTGADNVDECGAYTTRVVDNVESGVIYILVNGYNIARGVFDLTVSVTARPPEVGRWWWYW